MRETVLLINFQDAKQLREIKMILLSLKIKMKTVEKDYLGRQSAVCRNERWKKPRKSMKGRIKERDDDFSNLRESQLEQILYRIRRNG